MVNLKPLVWAGVCVLAMSVPALANALDGNGGNGHHYGWSKQGGSGVSRSAPGPMIGVGLPGLAA
jgi:hypothetical protein